MKKILLVLVILNSLFFRGWTQGKNERFVTLFNSSDFEQLITEGKREISNSPKNAVAYYYLGRAYFEKGEFKRAVDNLKKACELEPGGDNHYHLAIAYAGYAETASSLKQPFIMNDMIGALKKAIDLDPDHIEAKFLLSKFYATAPSFFGGDLVMARKYAVELIPVKNDYSNLIEAYVFIKEDNIPQAEGRLLKVLEVNPTLDDAYYKLNSIYSDREETFLVYLHHITNLHPGSPYPFYYLAVAQVDHHQYKEAHENLLKAISNDPEFMRAYYLIGKLSILTGSDYEQGIIFFKKYLSKPVTKKGLFPSHADAHWRIGMIYEELKIKNKAIEQYQLAISFEPDHEGAKIALKNIKN